MCSILIINHTKFLRLQSLYFENCLAAVSSHEVILYYLILNIKVMDKLIKEECICSNVVPQIVTHEQNLETLPLLHSIFRWKKNIFS